MAQNELTFIDLLGSQPAPTSTGTARGLWDTGTAELLTFFTSSLQTTASKEYYYEVWGSASLSCDDEKMFSVAYGHISGSGSLNEGGEKDDTPSRAIYSQFRHLCLDGNEGGFYLSGSTEPIEDFYVININRDKFGDKLDPGNFEINIAELNGASHANNVHTGSNVTIKSAGKRITLIDDSGDQSDLMESVTQTSIERNLVSGSLQDGIYSSANGRHCYGKVYPSQGIILISAKSLNQSASFNSVTGSNLNGDNSYKLFRSMSGSAAVHSEGFTARAIDVKHCSYYYCRIGNSIANYSSNPTYIIQTTGKSKGLIKHARFHDNPTTYITSIGLYGNDAQGIRHLLAVAKLSKPIKKSFTSELSITIKLEY